MTKRYEASFDFYKPSLKKLKQEQLDLGEISIELKWSAGKVPVDMNFQDPCGIFN